MLMGGWGVETLLVVGGLPPPFATFILSVKKWRYSLWGLIPRPMAHKTIALTTELRERISLAAMTQLSATGC